jgi:two-component system nitrate/nitrite response regulator NarL
MPRKGKKRKVQEGPPTERQREVLQAFADGYDENEASAMLHITVNTLRTHSSMILQRLRVHSRVHAVAIAMREHWID